MKAKTAKVKNNEAAALKIAIKRIQELTKERNELKQRFSYLISKFNIDAQSFMRRLM